MLIAVGTPLPEYRVKASTETLFKNNLIHDDEFARKCGYRSALVPGASIYAYIVRSLVELFGRDWLERGSAEIRFIHPVYEGEEVHVSGTLRSLTSEGALCVECQAMNPQGALCAVGTATLPPHPKDSPPALGDYPAGRQRPRKPITLQSLRIGEILLPVRSEFTLKTHWPYCQKTIRDHHPLFQKLIHPGWLLSQVSLILAENFDLTAWIQVSSTINNYRALDHECAVETRGRVLDKFELKGNHYIVLDLALFAGESCLQDMQYTVIFRIAPRAA